MAVKHQTAKGALYHNNHDGTLPTSPPSPGSRPVLPWVAPSGDINNDGWPDLFITCLGGNHLYKNNGDGTLPTTAKAGVADGRWSTGAAFGDYDGDGFVDLMVTNYVDFRPDAPLNSEEPQLQIQRTGCAMWTRGLRGSGDSLFTTMATALLLMFQVGWSGVTHRATLEWASSGRISTTPGVLTFMWRMIPL
jgi:hypothetical protein